MESSNKDKPTASATTDHTDDAHLPDIERALPPIDFPTFLLSLATSVVVSLGEAVDADGQFHVDLPLARQTIDLISLLQEKTKGNLTGEEERLIDQLLHDLRLKFISAVAKVDKRR